MELGVQMELHHKTNKIIFILVFEKKAFLHLFV